LAQRVAGRRLFCVWRSEALGTNRNTVVRAYDDLLASGFVESTVGRRVERCRGA